ncbi:hypothetical protein [Nocardia sp. MW-W600-9]
MTAAFMMVMAEVAMMPPTMAANTILGGFDRAAVPALHAELATGTDQRCDPGQDDQPRQVPHQIGQFVSRPAGWSG